MQFAEGIWGSSLQIPNFEYTQEDITETVLENSSGKFATMFHIKIEK